LFHVFLLELDRKKLGLHKKAYKIDIP